jgi:hypothetical protein
MRGIAAAVAATLLMGALSGSPVAAADQAIPQSTCLPENTPERSDWPVKVIYLHGWFAASGPNDTFGNRAGEFANRDYLDALARQYHIRIAAPLGTQVLASNGMLQWGKADLQQIEQLSMAACHVSALPSGLSLIGFSSGGFKARDIGLLPCEELARYNAILAVGTQTSLASRCDGKFQNIPEHKFPPDDLGRLLKLTLPGGQAEEGAAP